MVISQAVYAIWCRYCNYMLNLHSLTNCLWHYKLILRLSGVFGFLPMTLLLNKFPHPCFKLSHFFHTIGFETSRIFSFRENLFQYYYQSLFKSAIDSGLVNMIFSMWYMYISCLGVWHHIWECFIGLSSTSVSTFRLNVAAKKNMSETMQSANLPSWRSSK